MSHLAVGLPKITRHKQGRIKMVKRATELEQTHNERLPNNVVLKQGFKDGH
jgi:hypothetical protein